MIKGKVIGQVWATKKSPKLGGRKLLLVAQYAEGGEKIYDGKVVVAIDTLDTKTGEDVTVSFGSGARNVLKPPPNRDILVDAAISQIIEREG